MRSRMLKAAGWLLGGNISSQALRLASNLVLTRLLLPEAFGLVAAVNTLYFALVMFSDLGVWQSVVKSEHGTEPEFLGTAWAVQLMRGALLCVVVLLIAGYFFMGASYGHFQAGTVYADPRLPPMIAVFSLCALLQGLESMRLAIAQRELQVGHLARLELSGQIVATVLTLLAAWLSHSVWSLLVGAVASAAVRTVMSHWYLPGTTVRPCWHPKYAREIIGFGKWIFFSSIIGFLAAHGEKLILGGTLTTLNFGVFSIASLLMVAVIGVYSSLNAHIIFSTLSEALRVDERTAHRVYIQVQQIADLFLGVMAGGLFVAGHWVVDLLYDARYHDAGWMLQWLGLGLLAIRNQVLEQLMFAQGRPGWVTFSNLLRAVSLVVFIPMGYAVAGERGAIAAVVASQFVSWPVALLFKSRNGLLTWKSERAWLPALGLGLLGGWVVDQLMTMAFQ